MNFSSSSSRLSAQSEIISCSSAAEEPNNAFAASYRKAQISHGLLGHSLQSSVPLLKVTCY